MGLLTRESILESTDLKREQVEVPEWGGHVFVRTMTGSELSQWQDKFVGKNLDDAPVVASLLAYTLCDDNGKRLFADADIAALAGRNAGVLVRLAAVAHRMNPLSDKDVEAAAGKS